MDLANLQTFLQVARFESFSAAAENLYLTQSAVSKRIVSLEQELGVILFDRIGRHISLTQAGQALLPRAERILQELEDSRRAMHNLTGKIEGNLRIGTSHHIGLHRLPPVLRDFNQQYPNVELDIHFMDSEQAYRAVEAGELEIGVITLPPQRGKNLKQQKIWHDPLAFVVNRSHTLVAQRNLKLNQLLDYPAILPTSGTYTRSLVEQHLKNKTALINVRMATNYLETIRMLVSIGIGWSVLPRSMLTEQAGNNKSLPEELVELNIEKMNLARELGCIYHPKRTLSNAAHAFLQRLHDETM